MYMCVCVSVYVCVCVCVFMYIYFFYTYTRAMNDFLKICAFRSASGAAAAQPNRVTIAAPWSVCFLVLLKIKMMQLM